MASALADRIGSVASVLTVMAFLPQAYKIWRQREASAISVRTYLLLVSASTLWTWFGWVIASRPVIVTNSICLAVQLAILVLKLKVHRNHPTRHGDHPPTDPDPAAGCNQTN